MFSYKISSTFISNKQADTNRLQHLCLLVRIKYKIDQNKLIHPVKANTKDLIVCKKKKKSEINKHGLL